LITTLWVPAFVFALSQNRKLETRNANESQTVICGALERKASTGRSSILQAAASPEKVARIQPIIIGRTQPIVTAPKKSNDQWQSWIYRRFVYYTN